MSTGGSRELIPRAEIARRLGVTLSAVCNWEARPARGFPEPVVPETVALFDWAEVSAWQSDRVALRMHAAWKAEVTNDRTQLGYAEWVAQREGGES